ncbi:hypothetical protein GMI69_07295 [Eggerthellaceae bacterium zg-887]|nr:hypothetical protein [Xiamenia xianingshaonis]
MEAVVGRQGKAGSMERTGPMDLAMALFPKGLLDACGIEKVDPREVSLTPGLAPHATIDR